MNESTDTCRARTAVAAERNGTSVRADASHLRRVGHVRQVDDAITYGGGTPSDRDRRVLQSTPSVRQPGNIGSYLDLFFL